jgi:hypothetical protein
MAPTSKTPGDPASLILLSPKKRIDSLLSQNNAMEAVQALDPTTALFLIDEAGISGSLEVIKLLSTEQAQSILDLEAFEGEDLCPERLQLWLGAFFEANEPQAVRHMRAFDPELLQLLLKRYARISDLSAEGMPNDLTLNYFITPGQEYCVEFLEGEDDAADQIPDLLKKAIKELYDQDPMYVMRLLRSVNFETDTMLLESILMHRGHRLEELGFPPFDEAKAIFSYIDPDKAIKGKPLVIHVEAPAGAQKTVRPGESKVGAASGPASRESRLPLLLLGTELSSFPFLAAALDNVTETVRKRMLHELTALALHVHMAKAQHLGDAALLKGSAHMAFERAEEGLETLCAGAIEDAVVQAQGTPMRRLFQIGYSLRVKKSPK